MDQEQQTDLQRREALLRADRVRFELTKALGVAKCRADAVEDATSLMASLATPTFDADGRISTVALGGETFKSLEDAATAFLGARKYLAEQSAPAQPKTQQPDSTIADAWARATPSTRTEMPPKRTVEDLLKAGYSGLDLASEGWATPAK